jgi:hypothetical protein
MGHETQKKICTYHHGSIGQIQLDLFLHFKKMILVHFFLDNYTDFFHTVGIGWTQSLPKNTLVAFSKPTKGDDVSEKYTYPEADFCLFADWPHRKQILPVLDFVNLTECTSTIRWLLSSFFTTSVAVQHRQHPIFVNYPNMALVFSACENSSWSQVLLKDTKFFEKKIALCNGGSTMAPGTTSTCSIYAGNTTEISQKTSSVQTKPTTSQVTGEFQKMSKSISVLSIFISSLISLAFL